jgi:plastocyanin
VDRESESAFEDLGVPFALDETEDGDFFATQNAGQPCYLSEGGPPEDAETPCRNNQQEQPVFDGNQSYYNSGIIPYEGPAGNTFRVQLAPDIEEGSYFFYCAVHGPNQTTEVRVRPEGSDIPAQAEVSRAARQEIAKFAGPMQETFRDARDGEVDMQGEEVEGPFGGLFVPVFGAINEFLPRTINAKVGERVTWKVMGWDHTISFDVPRYFPIIRFARNGEVSLNPRLYAPAGGHPALPEQEGEGIFRIDGGTYDGEGFYSSGVFSGEPYAEYTLRFSRPGRYRYACLLHPPMVGTVVVR